MKKLLLFLGFLLLFCSYGKAQLIIHTSEIEKFHNLMKYIEEKAGGKLSCSHGDTTELQTAFEKNSEDSKLIALIDSLMNTTVRYERGGIRHITVKNFSEKIPTAKEAYRVAFAVLPDFCVELVGGIGNKTEIWVEYWNNHEHRKHIENSAIELSTNMEAIVESMMPDLKALFPDDVDMNVEVNIHLIIDGHDGGFFYGNHTVMDLLSGEFADFANFFAVLTHEIHHIYYSNWLGERFTNKERSQGEKRLVNYQFRFIIEGIATRYDFPFFSSEVKQMYANKDLLAELFDEWITFMREIKNDSSQAWEMAWDYLGDRSIEWQKKYWPGDTNSIMQGYRPTVFYYVSYNLFNSIYEHGGQEKLKYVIENPDKLLSVYNELYTDSMLMPRIPDDIVIIWQNNF
jgi:hypothetical protein